MVEKTSPDPRNRHDLTEVQGISPRVVKALSDHWIASAEEVLALTSTTDSRAGLLRIIGGDDAALEELIRRLRALVGDEAADRLQQPAEPRATGLRLDAPKKNRKDE